MVRANVLAEKALGSIVVIRTRVIERTLGVSSDGLPYNPDSLLIDAWDPRGTQVLTATAMSGIVEGEFYYNWDTSNLTIPGNYKVVITGTIGSEDDFQTAPCVVVLR